MQFYWRALDERLDELVGRFGLLAGIVQARLEIASTGRRACYAVADAVLGRDEP